MYIFTPNTLIKSAEINANFTELQTKTDYLSAPDSEWHIVGAAGEPAFLNSWVNHTVGTYPQCAFRKDALGYVHLQGLIKNGVVGDGTPPFQLPAGYRPLYSLHLDIVSNGAMGNIRISNDGYVRIQVGNNSWVSLDAKQFKAEQ